jgi:dihydroorotase-like cyclic amidohydrolase
VRRGLRHVPPRQVGTRSAGRCTLEDGVRRLTSEVAAFFGIRGPRRPSRPGKAADLVLFDPDTSGRRASRVRARPPRRRQAAWSPAPAGCTPPS